MTPLGVLLAANVLATRIVTTLAPLRFWHFWWPNRTHAKTAPTREDLLPAPHEANAELGARQTSST